MCLEWFWLFATLFYMFDWMNRMFLFWPSVFLYWRCILVACMLVYFCTVCCLYTHAHLCIRFGFWCLAIIWLIQRRLRPQSLFQPFDWCKGVLFPWSLLFQSFDWFKGVCCLDVLVIYRALIVVFSFLLAYPPNIIVSTIYGTKMLCWRGFSNHLIFGWFEQITRPID